MYILINGAKTNRGGFLMYQDRYLTCRDCGNEFVFSASGRNSLPRDFTNDPGRCPSCRAARKNEAEFRRRLPPEAPDVPGGMRQLRGKTPRFLSSRVETGGILQ